MRPSHGLQLRRHIAADLGPAVADQVGVARAKTDERPGMEIGLPLLLPSRPQRLDFFGVDRLVAAIVDVGRRALEDVQVAGGAGQMGDALDTAGSGADDRDAFVAQPVKTAVHVSAGIVIVPARGVEGMALEAVDSRDARQLRAVKGSLTHHDEARADVVAAVGADAPASLRLVPPQ